MDPALDPRRSRDHRYGLPRERWESLNGHSYWITGGATGFGHAISAAAAAAGAQVFLTGRRVDKLHEAVLLIGSYGISTRFCHVVPADVRDESANAEALKTILARCSALHGVVNSAALPPRTISRYPLAEESSEYWDAIMAVNVKGGWLATRAAMPHMIEHGGARALFLSSAAGWSFAAGYGQYNISKAAVNSLAVCLAEEYAVRYPDADIQINVLDPGQARTEMNPGSQQSPFGVVYMALALLSHPKGGPNGKFFHQDGRHLSFCSALPYEQPLVW
jgi:NAD(P)-dependent dehydrogenase (short-subunit alcohol dehydrogenase family)